MIFLPPVFFLSSPASSKRHSLPLIGWAPEEADTVVDINTEQPDRNPHTLWQSAPYLTVKQLS